MEDLQKKRPRLTMLKNTGVSQEEQVEEQPQFYIMSEAGYFNPQQVQQLPDDERMAAPKPPYNMPAQQTVRSRGYSGMPPTSYQNTMTMNPVPTQRPPSGPGMTAPQPKKQKRERKILSIIDPNTGKDLMSDVISLRSTPPKSIGSRGQSSSESIEVCLKINQIEVF
ncbi:Hypothetical predicted protein [Mytilus galloprovincialis]|uniref:Uncharacterized protein n=1 Tax=Mytilus galloprovincialis TaxID=29158 RepID=A0A8B6FFK0_MYTGA|nr:Hypothetical predicted protein [Mytilus galloprovincialis]